MWVVGYRLYVWQMSVKTLEKTLQRQMGHRRVENKSCIWISSLLFFSWNFSKPLHFFYHKQIMKLHIPCNLFIRPLRTWAMLTFLGTVTQSRIIFLICKRSFNLFWKCVFGSSQLVLFMEPLMLQKCISFPIFNPFTSWILLFLSSPNHAPSTPLFLYFFPSFLARIRCPPLSWWIIPPAGWRVQRSLESGTTDPCSSEYLWNPSVFQLAFILIFMSSQKNYFSFLSIITLLLSERTDVPIQLKCDWRNAYAL